MPAPILLIHGACHGAWCWEAVVPFLKAQGRQVRAIDLPGRAGSGEAGWAWTLASYAAAVAEAAAKMDGPVVAVGHSMGGQIISAAAERAPGRFKRLVYLSAFLPTNGDSVMSLARHDRDSELAAATHVSLLRGRVEILARAAGSAFYGDCSVDVVARATARLVPESLRPSLTRLRLTEERFGRIPKSYIHLDEDRALTPHLQHWMLERQRCDCVLSLHASHSPFLSRPSEVADVILEATRD